MIDGHKSLDAFYWYSEPREAMTPRPPYASYMQSGSSPGQLAQKSRYLFLGCF